MKIMKKAILLCFVFIIMISLTACSELRAMTITNDDGTIDEVVYLSLDAESVLKAGYDVEQMKMNIRADSINEAKKFNVELNAKIYRDVLNTTDQDVIKILESYLDGISVIISEWQNDNFMIGIRFKDVNVYKYFYEITGETKLESKTESHFFYDKVTYYGNTMYVKHHDLYERINMYYSLRYSEFVGEEDVELQYTYVTDVRREHSNADFVTNQNGQYYHTWIIEEDNIDQSIELYYNIANRTNCILACIGLTIIITFIIILITIIFKLIKKKHGSQN